MNQTGLEQRSPIGEKIQIEQMVPGGSGMGRLSDGRAAFVPGAVAGDVIEVRRFTDKKSFVHVDEFLLITASDDRIQPSCPVAQTCGGCDWMALSPAAQAKHKLSLVEQSLSRTGRVQLDLIEQPVRLIPSPRLLHYRTRVRLQVADGQLGFYSTQSHRLVTFQACEVASDSLNQALELLRPIVAQNRDTFSCVKSIELRVLREASPLDPQHASIHLQVGTEKQAPSTKTKNALLAALLPLSDRMLVRVGRDESARQSFSVPAPEGAETKIFVKPGGFTQVNLGINRALVERVLQEAVGAKTFLDIYCGSGNFSLPLLALGLEGVGVELSAEAIDAAREGAHEAGLGGEFFSGSSERVLGDLVRRRRRFDLVLVDPPRAGAKPIIEALKSLVADKLLMISCDPVTLARDIHALTSAGFSLQTVCAFDMFPQTHHVETFAILKPPQAGPPD